ncbi:MAG: alpha-L-fucosidase C-terminal domain-containing protein, partial [Planctomycetota bacterium]
LGKFGEAIYETRPWITFGEGPTKEPEGGFREYGKFLKLEYSAKDVRYTRTKDGGIVYAIVMGWPGASEEIVLKSFAKGAIGADTTVKDVETIGAEGATSWRREDRGLVVTTGQAAPDQSAFVLKVLTQ